MKLYSQRWWKLRWKDLRTFTVETQAHVDVDVGGLGIKVGIGLRWSCRFRLDGSNVWQECWWWVNLRKVNWCPQVAQKSLGGGCNHVGRVNVGWGV